MVQNRSQARSSSALAVLRSALPLSSLVVAALLCAAGCEGDKGCLGSEPDIIAEAPDGAAHSADAGVAADVSVADDTTDTATAEDVEPPAPTEGALVVFAYNVAGLPDGFSSSDPVRNTPLISPLLNGYPLVLVQEDFWYHAELRAETDHPYESEPYRTELDIFDMGDGLNRFAHHPFVAHERFAWASCHGTTDDGSDCMTDKGFSFARHEISPGVEVDIYNLHMDAGGSDEDEAVRVEQAGQLLAVLQERSAGRAVIVAGDTNLKMGRDLDVTTLERILDEGELEDGCRAVECGVERIDRVLFRSGPEVALTPLEWFTPGEFVDADGAQLSDHEPVALRVSWELVEAE